MQKQQVVALGPGSTLGWELEGTERVLRRARGHWETQRDGNPDRAL